MTGLVIFDCDGVLVDSEPISLRCTTAALNRFGYPVDEDDVFDRFLGGSTASMVAAVEASLGRGLAPEALDDLRREILDAFGRELRAVPGVARAVEPHHCSRNRLEKVFISSCARKRDIEFRRCSWRSAVGVVGTRTVMPGVSNELGGRRVRGCLVWG